jgi:hypothetical protein
MSMLKWVGFTSLGWVAGIPVLMVVSGLLEPLGLGNTAIAIGMSSAIAVFQWFMLRKSFPRAKRWMWLSPLVFMIPFLFADVIAYQWFDTTEAAIVFGTLTGAVVLAAVQHQFVLDRAGIRLATWMIVNVIAYALALVPPFTLTVVRIRELQLPGALSVTLSFATVLAGGPIIGWLTGIVLVKPLSTVRQ